MIVAKHGQKVPETAGWVKAFAIRPANLRSSPGGRRWDNNLYKLSSGRHVCVAHPVTHTKKVIFKIW